MTQSDRDMLALEALLEEAGAGPDVPACLMARVTGDALAEQPVAQRRPHKRSMWAQMRAALGGWQGLGGMAAATCAGFWLGFNPPANLPQTFDTVLYSYSQDLGYEADSEEISLLGMGWDLEEG